MSTWKSSKASPKKVPSSVSPVPKISTTPMVEITKSKIA